MTPLHALNVIEAKLSERGFDIAVPFVVRELEARLAADAEQAGNGSMFSFDLAPNREAVGMVVANSRALWPLFLGSHEHSAGGEHPLDAYTERAVSDAVAGIDEVQVFFGHGPAGRTLPIQRIAHHTGALPLSPGRLNVHPKFGPWIALRGVIVLPGLTLPKQLAPEPRHVCRGCSAPCQGALAQALTPTPSPRQPELAHLRLSERAERFLSVRIVCPVGQAERYTDEQIEFHYGALRI